MRRCPLCAGERHKTVFTARDVNSNTTDHDFSVVRCPCRMTFLNPVPRDLGRYYPATYDAHRDLGDGKKRRKKSHRFDRILDLTPGDLLDVGCGSGFDLLTMRDRGWRVAGVEMNPQAVERARAQGLDIRQGTLADARFPDGSFDVVTLFHVLEHVPDVLSLVQEIRRILRPGGLMLAQVPNFDGANARLFKAHWYELDVPRHVNFFSSTTLKDLAAKAGLDVVSLRWIESPSDFRRSFKNRFGTSAGLGAAKPLLKAAFTVLNFWRTGDMLEVLARVQRVR
jgi:2-polyprenyl-3-methyl-5-hydroxy-6-metoxy-1,4-benzoquinol methylase